MLNAAGIGSGLDVQSIITSLMNYERQPLVLLEKQQKTYEAQISAYGDLSSTVDAFETAMGDLSSLSNFELYSATSGDESIFTASATTGATAGSYNVTVDRLAQNHKLSSVTALSTDVFGAADPADALNFTVGTNSFSVNINNGGAGMTLSQIRDAVNNDVNNTSVTASVINGNNGSQQLVFTSKNSGYDERIQLSYGGTTASNLAMSTANVDALGVTYTDAQINDGASRFLDASLNVDGFAMTRATNSINDVISGVTLDLKSAGTTSLTVARDDVAVKEAVQNFVDKYNELASKIDTLGGEGGKLQGDQMLARIEGRLRDQLNTASTTTSGTFSYLSEIGIRTNRDTGLLEIDNTTFSNALTTDFKGVAELFGNATDGVAMRLEGAAKEMTRSADGMLAIRTDGLNQNVDRLKDRIESMEYRLSKVEERYYRQFTELDTFMAQMNGTTSFLANQLAALPGFDTSK